MPRLSAFGRLLRPFMGSSLGGLDAVIVVLAVSLASPVFVRIGGPTLVWLPDAAAHRAGGFDLHEANSDFPGSVYVPIVLRLHSPRSRRLLFAWDCSLDMI